MVYGKRATPYEVLAEFSDRDAGFKEKIYGDKGASWWKAGDFRRNVRYLRGYSRGSGQAIVMWQIPLGNTEMRAENNTFGHFQDNRMQWLLGKDSRRHLRQYRAGKSVPVDAFDREGKRKIATGRMENRRRAPLQCVILGPVHAKYPRH